MNNKIKEYENKIINENNANNMYNVNYPVDDKRKDIIKEEENNKEN